MKTILAATAAVAIVAGSASQADAGFQRHRHVRTYCPPACAPAYVPPVTYRNTCDIVRTCDYVVGCERYRRVTYLHRTIDSCGRVVRCWNTERPFYVGRASAGGR